MADESGAISVALTPIQLFAILGGESISAGELASNSWHRLPSPRAVKDDLAHFPFPLQSSADLDAQIRQYLAQNDAQTASAAMPQPTAAQRAMTHYPYPRPANVCMPASPGNPPSRAAMTRGFAVLGIVGAGAEIATGVVLLLTPEPTMVTKVAGGVLTVHGADAMQAAVRQLFSGRPVEDFTAQGAERAARIAGASEKSAQRIGVVLDVAVSFADLGAGVYKVAAIRAGKIVLPEEIVAGDSGRISLRDEEKAGGHTGSKHIDRSDQQLAQRLADEPKIPASSAWKSVRLAENVISDTLRANKVQIEAWAKSSTKANLQLKYSGTKALGRGIIRSSGQFEEMTNAVIRLRKVQYGPRQYFLLTSFPEP